MLVPSYERVGEQLVVRVGDSLFRVDRYTRFKIIFNRIRRAFEVDGTPYNREAIFKMACDVEQERDKTCCPRA